MTFEEFRVSFIAFLQDSKVNLGRRGTKAKACFFEEVEAKFDECQNSFLTPSNKPRPKRVSRRDEVLCVKPKDSRKALDMGKGVHAMTASESARADEQLNRSPFTGRTGKPEETDE